MLSQQVIEQFLLFLTLDKPINGTVYILPDFGSVWRPLQNRRLRFQPVNSLAFASSAMAFSAPRRNSTGCRNQKTSGAGVGFPSSYPARPLPPFISPIAKHARLGSHPLDHEFLRQASRICNPHPPPAPDTRILAAEMDRLTEHAGPSGTPDTYPTQKAIV